jgi:hypothetical protein
MGVEQVCLQELNDETLSRVSFGDFIETLEPSVYKIWLHHVLAFPLFHKKESRAFYKITENVWYITFVTESSTNVKNE